MQMNNFFPISNYYAQTLGETLKQKEQQFPYVNNNEGIAVTATCSGTNCTGGCKGTCKGTCAGGCKGTCKGTCSGTCSGTCTGTCSSTCSGNCAKTCTGGCETYCQKCQAYCQYEQTFSKNNGANKPTGAGKVFTWDSTVGEDKTILISATDWNKLAGYVENAASVCVGGSSGSITRAKKDEAISAAIFNSMSSKLTAITSRIVKDKEKTANQSVIYASDFAALKNGYNNAQIKSTLPSGKYPTSGGKNSCCQLGQACMTQAQGRPSLQPCTQSPGK
mgnify:FL=1